MKRPRPFALAVSAAACLTVLAGCGGGGSDDSAATPPPPSATQPPPPTSSQPSLDVAAPVELWVEPPTLKSIGLEWRLTGDSNRNATVNAEFREQGTEKWRPALSLARLQGERLGNLEPPRPN